MKIKRIQSQNILTEKQLPCTLMPMHDTEIVMYTTSSCSDCKRSKAWFAAQNVSFHEINIEDNEEAVAIVKKRKIALGANACMKNERTVPMIEIINSGRLPNLSDMRPMIGVARNAQIE